ASRAPQRRTETHLTWVAEMGRSVLCPYKRRRHGLGIHCRRLTRVSACVYTYLSRFRVNFSPAWPLLKSLGIRKSKPACPVVKRTRAYHRKTFASVSRKRRSV